MKAIYCTLKGCLQQMFVPMALFACSQGAALLSAEVVLPRESELPPHLRLPIDGAITTLDPGLTEDTASIELVEQLFLDMV